MIGNWVFSRFNGVVGPIQERFFLHNFSAVLELTQLASQQFSIHNLPLLYEFPHRYTEVVDFIFVRGTDFSQHHVIYGWLSFMSVRFSCWIFYSAILLISFLAGIFLIDYPTVWRWTDYRPTQPPTSSQKTFHHLPCLYCDSEDCLGFWYQSDRKSVPWDIHVYICSRVLKIDKNVYKIDSNKHFRTINNIYI